MSNNVGLGIDEDKWIAGEAIAEAVNAANLFRQKYGVGLLDDLPPSYSEDPEQCVLANAFNFDCQVDGLVQDPNNESAPDELRGNWYVKFSVLDEDKAKSLAEILKTGVYRWDDQGDTHLCVLLPKEIARIAEVFDAGNLDGKYYSINYDGDVYIDPSYSGEEE